MAVEIVRNLSGQVRDFLVLTKVLLKLTQCSGILS